MGKSSSKKRSRSDEDDIAVAAQEQEVMKKSKVDENGKSEVTKSESSDKKSKKEKKDKKERKDKSEKKEKKEKKDKKEKKEKKSNSAAEEEEREEKEEEEEPAAAEEPAVESSEKKSKKDRKDKKDKKDKKSKEENQLPPSHPDAQKPKSQEEAMAEETQPKGRFICFVGNLPYTATADSLTAHFAALQPTSVRLLTERDDPKKSRGIAFVEFDRFDRMKTCLEKFHHTEFEGRKINVELTYVPPYPLSP